MKNNLNRLSLNDYIDTSFVIIDDVKESFEKIHSEIFKQIVLETDTILPHKPDYKLINSLNKVCSTIEFQLQKVIIFDINLVQTFHDLTSIFLFSKRKHNPIIYSLKLLSEEMYLNGDHSYARLIRHDYEKNMYDNWDVETDKRFEAYERHLTYLQEVYSIAHEIIHIDMNYDLGKRKYINQMLGFFKRIAERWENRNVTESDAESYLKSTIVAQNATWEQYINESTHKERAELINSYITKQNYENNEFVKYIRQNLNNTTLAEECVCDMMATTTAIKIGTKYMKMPLNEIITGIVLAQENLSLLDYISRLEFGFREYRLFDLNALLRRENLIEVLRAVHASVSADEKTREVLDAEMFNSINQYNDKILNPIKYNLKDQLINGKERLNKYKEIIEDDNSTFISYWLDENWNYGGKFSHKSTNANIIEFKTQLSPKNQVAD